MRKYIIITLFYGATTIAYAQVGINTVDPEESLHVAGTLRVENTGTVTASKVLGRDAKGTVANIDVGDNVTINNNTLICLH